MNQFYEQRENQKSKRNNSDLQINFPQVKNQSDLTSERNYLRPKPNSIKINRNKLPPDFFPRSQSLKRKISTNRPALGDNNIYARQHSRKVESERMHISPEKTSFFGFFQEKSKGKNHANTINLNRKFDSRQDPKREKLIFENRNFTPIAGIQRNEFFINHHEPANIGSVKNSVYDNTEQDFQGTTHKGGKMSPRKEHLLKYKQLQQSINDKKQISESRQNSPKKISLLQTKNESEQIHNITFFNAKSTSFPPINKNANL